jgi:pyruvate/2-oxoglutarate dehydrogenase complex dihydrolipoamide dehydrogenase (E3) component
MTEPDNIYDVIVLGAGPVGQNVAARARAAGLTVAVVERELVGGECSYWACIPSKALLRPVVAVADARRVEGARPAVTGVIDSAGVLRRRDRYVTGWDDSYQADQYVRGIGADLVRGHCAAGRSASVPRCPPRFAAVVCPHSAHMKIEGPVRFVRTEPLTCIFVGSGGRI